MHFGRFTGLHQAVAFFHCGPFQWLKISITHDFLGDLHCNAESSYSLCYEEQV
jgi:hypothetical protein